MSYARNQIQSGGGLGISFVAGEAIATGLLVKIATTDGYAYLATATSEDLLGVCIQAAAAAGDLCTVAIHGDIIQTKVGSGGCTRGTLQMFVTGAKVTDVSGAVRVAGLALANGADGDLVGMLVAPARVGTA